MGFFDVLGGIGGLGGMFDQAPEFVRGLLAQAQQQGQGNPYGALAGLDGQPPMPPQRPMQLDGNNLAQVANPEAPQPPVRPKGLLGMEDAPAPQAQTVQGMGMPGASPQASGNPLSALGDMLGGIYGKGGPGDGLIALGTGLMSKRRIGEGLQAGLDNMQRQQLIQAQTGQANQKLQQQQAQLQSRIQSIKAKSPDMSDANVSAIAASDPLWQGWAKQNIPGVDAEYKPQLVTVNGKQVWLKPGETPADGTEVGPASQPEQYRPLTDPAERAKYGISPDDSQPYRIDTKTNKVEGVGGGGVKVYNGPQNDYTGALTESLGKTHAGIANGVETAQTRLRDISSMQGALQRIQAAGGTTGFGKEELTQLQSALNAGAHALGMTEPFDVADPQLMTKFNRSLAGAQAKEVGGARVTNFEMSNFLKANAGLGLSPDANARLLGIQGQIEERNIALGNAVRKLTAESISNGRKVDPASVEKLIHDYDEAHHITDPITGQDLTKNLAIPGLQQPQKGTGEKVETPKALPAWRRVGP